MSIEDRQREEKEQRRTSIVDAAERVIAREGVDGLTMGAIAKEARLSRSLLYVYFEDLNDIVLAVTLCGFRELRGRFEAAVGSEDAGLMQTRAIGVAYGAFASEEPVYFDLVARFESWSSDIDSDLKHEAQCLAEGDRIIEIMTDAIQQGIDDGTMRPDLDPKETAFTLWGYTHGLIQLISNKSRSLEHRHGVRTETLFERGIDLLGGALAGISEHPAPLVAKFIQEGHGFPPGDGFSAPSFSE